MRVYIKNIEDLIDIAEDKICDILKEVDQKILDIWLTNNSEDLIEIPFGNFNGDLCFAIDKITDINFGTDAIAELTYCGYIKL